MQKNTFYAVVLSTLFLIFWWIFAQAPSSQKRQLPAQTSQLKTQGPSMTAQVATEATVRQPGIVPEKDIVVETPKFRAILTNRGAAIKHWYLKDTRGAMVDIIPDTRVLPLSTFPEINFTSVQKTEKEIAFTANINEGWKLSKIYSLSDDYLHTLIIKIEKRGRNVSALPFSLVWNGGLNTDERDKADNVSLTRITGFTREKPREFKKFKPGEYTLSDYNWIAVDNRYFLAAIIPDFRENPPKTFSVVKTGKKIPPSLTMSSEFSGENDVYTAKFDLYLGPKLHGQLAKMNIRLEETVDFGMFGILGKLALNALNYFHKLTNNYGWAIVLLTFIIQVLVFPLTIKSFKASLAMKKLQPHVKLIQDQYKSDPRRLNMEMLNLYKTHKVNPLGGCLPMLLQIPIFWALFTTLRNAFELRGASWILWIKDLSAHDPFYILPVLMGLGMLVQQQMVSVSSDPAQKKMMLMMPIVFTFLFIKFPAGLVLYWLTNSIFTMIEQYIILLGQKSEV